MEPELVGGSFLPYSVAMVSPFDEAGDFLPGCVQPLVRHLVAAGAPGLLVAGSTGEQHCLSIDERCALYQLARDAAGPPVRVYAGVAAMKTKDAVRLALAAASSRVDGIMLGFTPYSKITQRDAEEYAKTVAGAVPDVPIFLYNNSGRQPFNLEPATFVRIVEAAPNCHGVKEVANSRVPEFRRAVAASPVERELAFFSGSDAAFLAQHEDFGFNGLTSVAGQIYTSEMMAVVQKLRDGDAAGARVLFEEIAAGVALLAEGGMLQSIKHILRARGAPAGHCCLPLQPLTPEQEGNLNAHFQLTAVTDGG